MSLPQIDTRSSLMRHSPSLTVGMSTSTNSKSLRPTSCAAFIRLSTSHKGAAANILGSPSATQRFFRWCEPGSVGVAPMLDDHSIFWTTLEWVYGHDVSEHGLLVNPGQHRYRWRMIEPCLEPAE